MKKKIIFLVAACLVAVVTLFNINMAQQNQSGDISLADIAVMAQASGEINWMCPNGCHRGGDHCWCYGMIPDAHEHDWGDGIDW